MKVEAKRLRQPQLSRLLKELIEEAPSDSDARPTALVGEIQTMGGFGFYTSRAAKTSSSRKSERTSSPSSVNLQPIQLTTS
jgi:hypothetical protein